MDDSGAADAVAQKFVGRTEELATVARSLDQSIGGRTQVMWIEGEPGSGKTGLLNASIRLLPSSFRVLRAEADESAIGVDMDLVRQFGPVAAADGFAAGLQLLDFFDTAQDAGPLAIAVEDLHWADLASRRALLTVARRLRNDHVILFITSRPFWVDDGWERFVTDPERCNRITVKGLTVCDIAELARRLGKQLDRRSTERLHRHTQGHALYVQTLLTELSLEQLTSAEADLPAPRSLASTTTARVADLPNEPRLLASALAVVNQRRALGTIATIANVSDPERALEPLLDTGFVTWSPGELGTPVEFTHPLFRSAIYEDLSPASRRDLHLAAAEILDPEASLVHRVAAASPGDEALVDDLIAAADREVDRGALGLAARYLLWASSLSADLDQIEGGLLRATRLLLDDGQVDQAKTVRDQIMAVRVGPVRSLLLGQLAWTDGDAVTSERWLVEAVHLADDDPQAHWVEIDALIQLARLYGTEGRGSKAREAASHALALQPEDEAAEVNAWCELATAEALLRGAPASLDLLAGRLRADPRSIVSADADLLVIRGALGFFAGRTHSAIADLRIALDLARLGAPAAQLARAHIQLAQLLISAGDWDEAIVHARLGISVVEDSGQVWLEAQAHAALASIRASRGEWELATDHISRARRAAGTIGSAEAVFTARIAEGALARARGDPAGVINALTPLIGAGVSASLPMNTSLGWWPNAIHAFIDAGDLSTADRQLGQLRSAAEVRGLDFQVRMVGLQARLREGQGKSDSADIAFSEAITAMGPDEALLDRALLHHQYGRFLRARRRRHEAVAQLTLAHQLLSAVGAEPYRRRVAEDLESCGLHADSPSHRSPLGLTNREQDVASLVAKGLTNREVAAQLYVSSKAVEYHLRNIFGKLGISSRNDLPAALFARSFN